MLLNYLKVAIRSLQASRTFSFINIAGLSIGIAASVLIVMVVLHEFSYDHFNVKGDRIFRAEKQFTRDGRHSLYANPQFAPTLMETDPRVENYVRTFDGSGRIVSSDDDHVFFEDKLLFADTSFFSIFTFPLLQGDRSSLTQPSTAIITESIARKYFGGTSVIGKTLTLDKKYPLTVVGLANDPPVNSTVQFGIVVSFSTLLTMPAERSIVLNNSSGFPTYVLLRNSRDLADVTKSIEATHYTNKDIIYSLAPLYKNHFNSNFGSTATTKYAFTFLSIAGLILLLALINYMNLTTARATIRSKEVGVRKVIGARRSSLSIQFYFESGLTTIISFAIAVVLIEVLRRVLANLLGITLDPAFLSSPLLYGTIASLLLLCIVISGSYPAIVLPSFKPVDVLKGDLATTGKKAGFRKVLTVVQFSVSIFLAICAVIMSRQLSYMSSMNTGLDRDQVMVVPIKTLDPAQRRTLKNKLEGKSGINGVAVASTFLYKDNMSGVSMVTSPFNKERLEAKWMIADDDFLTTLHIKPIESHGIPGTTYHLLNESAATSFGMPDEPTGQALTLGGDHVPAVTGPIAGVVADFNYQSPRDPIQPLIISIVPDSSPYIGDDPTLYVRLGAKSIPQEMIATIKSAYDQISDGTPFSYSFLDEAFNQQQLSEQRVHEVFEIFATIAMVIACMGLFGLITFSSQRRKKELSIRKLLGATVSNILMLISSETILLLAISILIATPAALFVSRSWLSNFFYQVSIASTDVLVPVGIAIAIALAIVGIQGIKVALTNPARNLKND